MADLWVIDSSGDDLWRIDPLNPGRVTGGYGRVGAFPSGLTTPTDIISYDGDLWVIDDSGDELWRINPDDPSDTSGVYGEVGSFAAALSSPQGLAFLDGDFWVAATSGGDELWRINSADPGDTSGVYGNQGNFTSGLQFPLSLTSHDGDLWATDNTGDQLYRINPANPADVSGVYGLVGSLAAGVSTPTGLTSYDGDLWVTDTTGEELFRINPANPADVSGVYGLVGIFPAGLDNPSGITAHSLGGSPTSAPNAPDSPSVTSTGNTSISATFSAASTGEAADTLDIRWREGTTGSWTEIIGVTSPRSITGLTEGTLYQVAVRGVNTIGNGAWSDPPGSATTDSAELMPTIGVVADSEVEQGTALARTLPAATGGDLPVTYSVTGLPSGMTFDSASRVLAWPAQTSPSSHELTYTATDTDGDQANRLFTVKSLLALSDFVAPAGTEIASSGLFTSGVPTNSGGVERLWGRSPRTAWGTLTDGDFEFDGISINEIRRATNGSNFRLLKNGGTGFNTYFATGGGGEDATFYILTEAVTIEFNAVANILTPSGGNFFNFTLPDNAGWRSALSSIAEGDRFIMGWTVPSTTPPSTTFYSLRARLTLPVPALAARVSRIPPTTHHLRAHLVLPAPSLSARVSRIERGSYRLRAHLVLPVPALAARVSRIPPTTHHLRAALTLPLPSLSARVQRIERGPFRLRAHLVLPVPALAVRVSRILPATHHLRAALTLPLPSLSARVSQRSSGIRYLRAHLVLPVPVLTGRVSLVMTGFGPPAIPPAPFLRPVSHSGVLVYFEESVSGRPTLGFDLRFREFGTTRWIVLFGVGVSPFARSGLRPLTSYEWEVRAVNDTGSSNWSRPEFSLTAPALDVTRHLDLVISQYAESTRLTSLLGGILEVFQAELVDPLHQLPDLAILALASGIWLDYLGERLGLTRPYRLSTDLRYFGFGDASDRGSFDEAVFRSTAPDLSNQVQIGDNWYRSLLKGRALTLRLGDSVPDIERVCAVVFDGGGYVSEDTANLAITIHVTDSREGFVSVAENAGVLPSPAGIAISISTS